MDDPSSISASESEWDTQSMKRKGRRGTQLRSLTFPRNGHLKMSIEFDQSTGNPLGGTRKMFKSFVALLGRTKVSILKSDWKDVEESVKNEIWQSIMVFHFYLLCLYLLYLTILLSYNNSFILLCNVANI